MMKKLLIFMLVLGFVSSASAAIITLAPTGSATHAAGTVAINVVSDTADFNFEYALEILDVTYASFISITATEAAGQAAKTTDYGDALGVGTYTIAINTLDTSPDEQPNVSAGVQWNALIDFTGSAVGQDATIVLLDVGVAEMPVMDSYTIQGIPEPMTIALLGLGSLFLLRRRK